MDKSYDLFLHFDAKGPGFESRFRSRFNLINSFSKVVSNLGAVIEVIYGSSAKQSQETKHKKKETEGIGRSQGRTVTAPKIGTISLNTSLSCVGNINNVLMM